MDKKRYEELTNKVRNYIHYCYTGGYTVGELTCNLIRNFTDGSDEEKICVIDAIAKVIYWNPNRFDRGLDGSLLNKNNQVANKIVTSDKYVTAASDVLVKILDELKSLSAIECIYYYVCKSGGRIYVFVNYICDHIIPTSTAQNLSYRIKGLNSEHYELIDTHFDLFDRTEEYDNVVKKSGFLQGTILYDRNNKWTNKKEEYLASHPIINDLELMQLEPPIEIKNVKSK